MTEPRLDEHSSEPLHLQLQRLFIDKIESRAWSSGEQLAGEIELSKTYEVSRSTVRQALLALVNQGYLTRKQGKGTYIAERKHELSVLGLRFSSAVASEHQLLRIERDAVLPSEAAQLGIPESEGLTVIERLHMMGEEPVGHSVAHLPSKFSHAIEGADLTLSLAEVLRDRGILIKRYSATVEPVLLSEYQREQLHSEDDPALGLLITRTAFSYDETRILHSKSTFRGDRCRAIFG